MGQASRSAWSLNIVSRPSAATISPVTRHFSAIPKKIAQRFWKSATALNPPASLTPLVPPPDEWREVTLPQLLRFFDNPARFFLENRLGIRLENIDVPLEEREPFTVGGLEAYSLKQELLEICLKEGDSGEFYAIASRRGILPPALHGEMLFKKTVKEVSGFAGTINQEIAGSSPLKPMDFELS
jgi:exodeoxyribonuclease V gamma subunit